MPRCTYRSTNTRSRYLPSDCKWCGHNEPGHCEQLDEYRKTNVIPWEKEQPVKTKSICYGAYNSEQRAIRGCNTCKVIYNCQRKTMNKRGELSQ